MPAANQLVDAPEMTSQFSAGNWVARSGVHPSLGNQVLDWALFKGRVLNKVSDGGASDPYSGNLCPTFSQLDAQKAVPPSADPDFCGAVDTSSCSSCVPDLEPPLVTWSNNGDSTSMTSVERDSGSGFVAVATVGAGGTSWSDSSASPGDSSIWSYRVRHLHDGVYSGYSNTASVTLNPPCNC